MRAERFRKRFRRISVLTVALLAALVACEEETAPPIPDGISVYSGDGQYSKVSTSLQFPLVVRVTLPDGSAAVDYAVRFAVIEGDGQLSTKLDRCDADGFARTRLTLGTDLGVHSVRATVDANGSRSVVFSATAGLFFCPEEDPTFVQHFFPANELFLFTKRSTYHQQAGAPIAGVVQVGTGVFDVDVPPDGIGDFVFTANPRVSFPEDKLLKVVRDISFSAAGDLYLAWTGELEEEVIKSRTLPDTLFRFDHFSGLESFFGSEITRTRDGILVGCDEFGPFVVGCRDTLTRFAEAMYGGLPKSHANNDAVAVDGNTGDIYFIYVPDSTLLRLPMNGLVASGPVQVVTQLSEDEASGANGMVVWDTDGSIYILVDTDDTKAIINVTAAGVKTTVVDFFTRATPGKQRDLAIRGNLTRPFLYTVDTENNTLLVWDGVQQLLAEAVAHPNLAHPEALSLDIDSGERLGLVLIPNN